MPGDEQGVAVPLSLFGGMVTELSGPSQPEGVSPDCQDVAFVPGSVKQRECLRKIFPNPIDFHPPFQPTLNPTLLYQKTFVQENEDPLNLYLDSQNRLWEEDVTNSPNVSAGLGALPTPTGSIRQGVSVTAFGREYFAFSDGLHGAVVPLQFDGTFLDRVTQDGPGAGVVAGDEGVSGVIAASPNGLRNYTDLTVQSGSETGFLVTLILHPSTSAQGFQIAHSFKDGDQWKIAGVGAGYDGTVAISSVQFVQVFPNPAKVTITYYSTLSGLAPVLIAGTASVPYYQVVNAATTYNPAVGTNILIAGAGVGTYDGTWQVRYIVSTSQTDFVIAIPGNFNLANSGNGTYAIAGSVSAGQHQVVVMFLTRQGYITKPSPPFSWNAAGNLRTIVSNIPIGPSNVVARILAFTGAGGDNFFSILASLTIPQPSGPPIVIQATVIPDNTSTTATLDFSDNALFGASAIDIPGRNYFAQVVLTDCIGCFPFASRMFWWGERNKIQNLVNMGFEGGYLLGDLTVPLGWTVDSSGGTLANGGAWTFGMCWQITGDGSTNAKGQISQTAYQDDLGIPIIQPNTFYSFRFWAQPSLTALPGTITVELFSTASGVLATASMLVANLPEFGGFLQLDFGVATPPVIPPDTVVRFYEKNLPVGQVVLIDETMLVPTLNPYRDALFRGSYVNAPEQMDGVTGTLGSTSDTSAIKNVFQLRNSMYFHTLNGLQSTTDNGNGEPGSWNVPEITDAVGSISVKGTDAGKTGSGESGEQFEFVMNESGVYIFNGGETLKISQEIQHALANGQPGWDSINKATMQTAWLKNDITNRRLYIGVPTGEALAPNILFVMDYRELNDFSAIAGNAPTRESMTGRMIAKEFCRKWTRWNIFANCAEIMDRANGVREICFGAGNGLPPGAAPGFGNAYTLDENKLTDDDYGQVTPYYTTYFFVSRDQEQQLGLGAHRKLATYLSMFVTGTGQTAITPYSDTLTNPFPDCPAYPLNQNQNHEYEWELNVTGERIALKIGSVPNQGQTDNGFNIEHMAITMKTEPMAPLRGAM